MCQYGSTLYLLRFSNAHPFLTNSIGGRWVNFVKLLDTRTTPSQDNSSNCKPIKNYYRWSRGSVLTFSTQVRRFKPGRSRRIFKCEKILSTPSFGGEVQPSVPCRRFAACKRSLNGVKSSFRQNYRTTFSPTVPTSAAVISHIVGDVEAPGGEKWEHLKKRGKAMASYP